MKTQGSMKREVSMKGRNWAIRAMAVFTAGWALAAGLSLTPGAVQAAAPLQKSQAPGYYRMMLGDFEITALSDGTFPAKAHQVIPGMAPKDLEAALARSFLTDPIEESVNGFLINTGSKLVLIDTGAGVSFGPTLGKLLTSLKASGYRPDQVDEVYITHMHGDHIGGLIVDGKAAFPNAVVRAGQKEADYWLSEASREAAPDDVKGEFDGATKAFEPYVAAGRFKPISGDVMLVPGVRAVASPGHTPGHTVYVAESKGQTMMFWGDTMHVAAVQFADPSLADGYDKDAAAGVAQRKKIFAEAAEHRYWVAGAHLSFPGIGHLRAAGAGAGYTYVHANYTSMQGINGQ
jgi:glyoxylase-like metal-dependent hydrolase (beta-lactamase superfamily II)